MTCVNVFLYVVSCLFIFLRVFIEAQSFKFDEVQFMYNFFFAYDTTILFKKALPNQSHKDLYLCFLLRVL